MSPHFHEMAHSFLSLYIRSVLSDEDGKRIQDLAMAADRETLLRWVRELLDDRKERRALLRRLARQLAYTRRRLRQASNYLDGLLRRAEGTSREPWPGRVPCPHCGAPAVLVRAEQGSEGHVVVHEHPDGVYCERPPVKGRPGP
jgi:hypothetical protein